MIVGMVNMIFPDVQLKKACISAIRAPLQGPIYSHLHRGTLITYWCGDTSPHYDTCNRH